MSIVRLNPVPPTQVPPVGSVIIRTNSAESPSTTWPGTTWVSCAVGLSTMESPFYAVSQRNPGQQNSDVNTWPRNNSAGQKWWLDLYANRGNRDNATVWLRTA